MPSLAGFKMGADSLEYNGCRPGLSAATCPCCFCCPVRNLNNTIMREMLACKVETMAMAKEDRHSRFCQGVINHVHHCFRFGIPFEKAIWAPGEESNFQFLIDQPPRALMFSEQVENDFGTPSKKKRRIQWPSPPRASRRQVQAYRRREKMAAVVFESEVKMKKAEEMGAVGNLLSFVLG